MEISTTHPSSQKRSTWPKIIPPLTEEQKRISDDFMHYWLKEVLPKKYGIIEKFNHGYVVENSPAEFQRSLEIGIGTGGHLAYEKLNETQQKNYFGVDIRDNVLEEVRKKYPWVNVVNADCQKRLPFEEGFFDRILAVHVLEHLPDLPSVAKELHRVCQKETGVLSLVIPAEGGLAYRLAQAISARRIFRKRYGQSYDWFIRREHLNNPTEVLNELKPYFELVHSSYFPLKIPLVHMNVAIGFTLRAKKI